MGNLTQYCLACALGSIAAPIMAQQPPTDDTADADNILVTARKTEETLGDVPGSANVLTGEQIEARVLDKFDDFIRTTPGATVVNAGPDYLTDISIRGQGGGRNGFTESATGIYRNGVYVAGGGFGGRTYNRLDLFDVQQFEVYRGPQGALYGRNAVGGAVNVISTRPDAAELSARATVRYDERDRINTEVVVNSPIGTGGSALRLGGFYTSQTGGFITNVNTGDTLDVEEVFGLRGSFLLALAPNWNLTLTGERYEQVDAPSFSDLGVRLPATNPAAQFDPGIFERISSTSGRVQIEESTLFAELDGTIGDNDFTAVFTYKDRDAGRVNDDLDKFLGFQGVGATALTVAQSEAFDRIGAEIRLASPTDQSLRWLIGADFQSFEDDVETRNEGTSNIATLRELGQRTDLSSEDLTSYSVFGLLEYRFAEAWSATAELRVLVDERDFVFERIDRVPTPLNGSQGPVVDSTSDTAVLPVITLKRELGDASQIYARFATGFRPGGFNTGTENLNALRYGPERAYSGELGVKADIDGWRVALAAYYQLVDDLQIVSTVSANDTTTVLQNIPDADYYGFEAQISKRFTLGPGQLRLNASFATADGRFGDNALITFNGATIDLSGTRVNRVRDYQIVFNADYRLPLGGGWRGFININAQAEGGGFENATGASANGQTSRPLDEFQRYDVRIGLDHGRISASVFAQNIADDVFLLQTIQLNEFYSTRRIIGGEVTLRLGQ